MALELPLDRMQRWMQAVIVHPGTQEAAVACDQAQAELPVERLRDVILPSARLSSSERLGVYQGMYLMRMEEALASDYPGLKHFLGERGFFELITGYVQVHPSRSYTLNRLGDQFPEHVRSAAGLPRRDFCYDLARLELAVSEVFDAPETPPLRAEEIAAVAPDAWDTARLEPVAAFRLLAFRHPVSAYLDRVKQAGHDHPKIRRKDAYTAVYRRTYAVWRHELSRPAHDLLADLVGGMTLGAAVSAAMRRGDRRGPTEDELFRWFREWVSGGVFAKVVLRG